MSDITARGPLTALVTDDDPVSLAILETLLNGFNIETVTASNVAQAKSLLLADNVPHLAFLDVLLPDGDGIDILLEIRRAQVPTVVAFVSASLAEFPFHKCGSHQPDMIFEKPIDPIQLCSWIQDQTNYFTKNAGKFHVAAPLPR